MVPFKDPLQNDGWKSMTKDQKEDAVDFLASFVISGILAATFKTMNAPIERVKLILQTQASSEQIAGADFPPYKGFLNALGRIQREQGFWSLWRGNFSNLCRYFPTQSLNFAFYDIYYKKMSDFFQPRSKRGREGLAFLAGGTAGATSCSIVYPLDFCTTRLSVDVGDGKKVKRQFFSLPDCLGKVYRTDGFRGYYQGFPCAISGMFLYRATYFGMYTTGKAVYLRDYYYDPTSHKVTVPFFVSLILAQIASLCAGVITYPIDTVSRHLMLKSGRGKRYHTSVGKEARKILRVEGPAGFYRGVFTNMLRTTSSSFVLVFYDLTKGYYERVVEGRRVSRGEASKK